MKQIKQLLNSNECFCNTKSKDYEDIVSGQSPQVTLITCSDSRVPPHCLCEDTVNRVFTIENMGNQIPTSHGTVDYGILHLKSPLLVVMGHTNCGAVNASLTDYSQESEHIVRELNSLDHGYRKSGVKVGHHEKRADMFAQANVDYQVSLALDRYKEQVGAGNLTVVGMMFDFANTYGDCKGSLYVTNVNGETDVKKLKDMVDDERVKRV